METKTEAAEAAETPTPETKLEVSGADEPKVEYVKETVVDVSGYDTAIAAKEELREYVAKEDLPSLEAEIAGLRTQKEKAAASYDVAELAHYRKEEQNRKLAQTLGEAAELIPINDLPGGTFEERLQAANLMKNLVAKKEEQLAELKAKIQSGEPTPQQTAAHGTPLVPGTVPASTDAQAELHENINKGDVRAVAENPDINKLIKEAAGLE